MSPFSARVIRCCNPFHLSCLLFPSHSAFFSKSQMSDFVRRISWKRKGGLTRCAETNTSLTVRLKFQHLCSHLREWKGRGTEEKKKQSKRSRHLLMKRVTANMSLHVWGMGWKLYNHMRDCKSRRLCTGVCDDRCVHTTTLRRSWCMKETWRRDEASHEIDLNIEALRAHTHTNTVRGTRECLRR